VKKGAHRVVLFASIERGQHDALRYIAYKEKRSIADITRQALNNYIKQKSTEYSVEGLEPKAIETLEARASPLVRKSEPTQA